MDLGTYLEQLYEILTYILDQINLSSLSKYYNYFFVAVIFLIVILFISYVIKKRHALAEYIEDGVALLVDFSQIGGEGVEVDDILADFYNIFYQTYGRKQYFSIEFLIRSEKISTFIFFPRGVLENIKKVLVSRRLKFKDVTSFRERFLDSLENGVMGLDLELAKDFIFPLGLKQKSLSLASIIEKGEWLFIQLLCRPAHDRWRKALDRYLLNLKKGKEVLYSGCLGGFLRVVSPVFTFIANMLTFLIHGSSGKTAEVKREEIDDHLKRKFDLVSLKRGEHGFETAFRVFAQGFDKERGYYILEQLLDLVSNGTSSPETQDEEMNSYVATRAYDKFKSSLRNDLILANMEATSVDVLNKRELSSLVSMLRKL
ncbi:hypothetical protein JW766_02710 [Candidatus Dojkabacteria bacterium]|nr:hypothetical protein [Candidatus Dojkabacteria bacterium]